LPDAQTRSSGGRVRQRAAWVWPNFDELLEANEEPSIDMPLGLTTQSRSPVPDVQRVEAQGIFGFADDG
jgi:hypothetical protein